MIKLTSDQVKAVDTALLDIGIKFLDIRMEMTDHAATAIESMEGTFERRLRKYIFENKAELKKNYSQFRTNAGIKAVKLLISNIITIRFVALFAVIYVMLYANYSYVGMEETSGNFLVLGIILSVAGFLVTTYRHFVKSTRLFSTAERLMPAVSGVTSLLVFPYSISIEKADIADELKVLYYAFSLSLLVIIFVTYRFLAKFYRTRYLNQLDIV